MHCALFLDSRLTEASCNIPRDTIVIVIIVINVGKIYVIIQITSQYPSSARCSSHYPSSEIL